MSNEGPSLIAIGVMTGNSLDGVDVVLSKFMPDGRVRDLAQHSVSNPTPLVNSLRALRDAMKQADGDPQAAVRYYEQSELGKQTPFADLNQQYTDSVVQAVSELQNRAAEVLAAESRTQADVIGFHGQTLAHRPPSVAKSRQLGNIYTVQLGDGQLLADKTGICVVNDFRSDDVMNAGEGAPLAPMHHQHISRDLEKRGQFPIVFCNAGNTSNMSIISRNSKSQQPCVLGWDAGPFNNYPDYLMRQEAGQAADIDGKIGGSGRINKQLLRVLFDRAVVRSDGSNFLLAAPPKSGDPQWYKILPELEGKVALESGVPSFADRLRTAEYFSAYVLVHSLTMLPEDISAPGHFALCGGGWKNPLSRMDFSNLLQGKFTGLPILEEHQAAFEKLAARLQVASKGKVCVEDSLNYGYDGTAMEARIFADAAVCRLKGVPFTTPQHTGANQATVAGVLRFPKGQYAAASEATRKTLELYHTHEATLDPKGEVFDRRWSRASAGWFKKISDLKLEHNNWKRES